jgi:hypothetical protein
MENARSSSDARQYERLPFTTPLFFKVCSEGFLKELHLASSRNVSRSGLCFRSAAQPPAGSIIQIDLDLATLNRCLRTEGMLFEFGDSVLGKVIWTRPSGGDMNAFDVGVAFVKAGEGNLPEVARFD